MSRALLRTWGAAGTLSAVLFLFVASQSAASGVRLATLGGETRLLDDTSNLFVFPALAVEFPHVAIELFDDWAAIVYPLSERHSIGVSFNRPTGHVDRLTSYISRSGSDRFKRLDPRPWVDAVYALRLGDGLSFGVAGRFDYDVIERGGESSASTSALRLGTRLGTEGGHLLDAAVGIRRLSLEDTTPSGLKVEETDGTGFDVELRARVAVADGVTLLPFFSYESASFALAPDSRDVRAIRLGVGANVVPAAGVLAVAGIFADYNVEETAAPGQAIVEESQLSAPVVVIASEAQVGSMLFRLGLRHESALQRFESAGETTFRQFDSTLEVNLGLGLEFGPVLVDGHLERDFLRDGPHFIGGSRHGGGIFSRISILYRFPSS